MFCFYEKGKSELVDSIVNQCQDMKMMLTNNQVVIELICFLRRNGAPSNNPYEMTESFLKEHCVKLFEDLSRTSSTTTDVMMNVKISPSMILE